MSDVHPSFQPIDLSVHLGITAKACRYRKRPVVCDAVRYDGTAEAATPIINWILANGYTARYVDYDQHGWRGDTSNIHIDTLEGTMVTSPGDYVVKGIEGEFYPVKPSIFEASYEPLES